MKKKSERKKIRTFLFCAFILISYITVSLSSSALAQEIDGRDFKISFGKIIEINIFSELIVVKDMIHHEEYDNEYKVEYFFSYSGITYIYMVTPDTRFKGDKSLTDLMPGNYINIFYIEGDFGVRIATYIHIFEPPEENIRILPEE